MKTFIACLVIISGYMLACKYRSINKHTAEASEHIPAAPAVRIAFNDIELLIDELTEKKNQLEIIENMITDIENCDPSERATAFNISMPNNNCSVSLLANNSSDSILKLLYSERHALRSSIVKSISILSGMCHENVNANVAINYSRGAAKYD